MKAGSGKEALEEVLTDLAAYVEYHLNQKKISLRNTIILIVQTYRGA